jgi:ParB family chromosome partitioning protein
MAKKRGLGKGLSAILEDVEDAYKQDIDSSRSDSLTKEIDIDKIAPNPYQPRKTFDQESLIGLSESIKKHGLLQPIVVVKKGNGYMLIAGERRLRASKMAGAEYIKAVVTDFESENLRELALIENIQREDLNPIELAHSYSKLIEEYGITQDELSGIIHKSRTQITNTMRLLRLSSRTQKMIEEGKISQGHAKVLVGLDEDKERLIVDTIVGQKLSVRECEELVKRVKNSDKQPSNDTKSKKTLSSAKQKEILKLLSNRSIKAKINSNNLIIDLSSGSNLERILELLT